MNSWTVGVDTRSAPQDVRNLVRLYSRATFTNHLCLPLRFPPLQAMTNPFPDSGPLKGEECKDGGQVLSAAIYLNPHGAFNGLPWPEILRKGGFISESGLGLGRLSKIPGATW